MSQNTQVQALNSLMNTLSGDEFKSKLKESLPAHINVDAFVRNTMNAIQLHPQQDKILNSDRKTLFLSCQKAAADGLLLDGREATLVAFWNKDKGVNDIQYIPMTQGLVKAARNSGEIVSIFAEVVHENDFFRYRPNIDDVPEWEPDWKTPPSQRGKPVMAYGVVKLKDGSFIVRVLHAERILQIGNSGKNGKQYDPAQGAHWAEWWRKTVIRNVLKYSPKSSELQHLMDLGDRTEFPDMNHRERQTENTGVNVVDMLSNKVDKSTGEIIDHDASEQTESGNAIEATQQADDQPQTVNQDFASQVEM